MASTWFISDTHFGHKNILEYEKESRGFDSVDKMNEVMIKRWNDLVHPNDVVYHLGDFCFGKNNIAIAGELNGKKRLILGNHDIYDALEYRKYFEKIFGAFVWNKCLLTHIPVHPSHMRGILNIHGHLHSNIVEDNYHYFNVSCEQNNLSPIHQDIIMGYVDGLTI